MVALLRIVKLRVLCYGGRGVLIKNIEYLRDITVLVG
jgi:hypothetical protein